MKVILQSDLRDLGRTINHMAMVEDANRDLSGIIADLLSRAPLDYEFTKELKAMMYHAFDQAHRAQRDRKRLEEILDQVSDHAE